MKKIVVIGDIHGRSSWKLITNIEKDADVIVFIGDYFDTHEDISPLEQMNNFEQIIAFKKQSPIPVILLIGNHDHHYFPEVGYSGTSGYQAGAAVSISFLLNESRSLLQMAYNHETFLFSHAGVSESWVDSNKYNGSNHPGDICEFVNELWLNKPKYPFMFNGRRGDQTGESPEQTPIWIRPRSLMADCQSFKKSMIQIVGHTQQRQIDIEGKATGGRYYFIDTLGTSGEYLIINDNKLSISKI